MKTPIVIYLGPSMLDGAPIVVLASVGSSNVKTGSMVQTWIMRADVHPSEVSHRKSDSSVCGACPRRHSLGGDCYVQIVHAPRSVWESWDRQGRPGENWTDERSIIALQCDALAHGLRLGSYGDPAAVPHTVWVDLIDALQPRSVVGYTHQWRVFLDRPGTMEHYTWLRDHVMASCDSVSEAAWARQNGWRFFLAVAESEIGGTNTRATVANSGLGAIQCPATRDKNPLTCNQCGICDGVGARATRASVYLLEHGMRSLAKAKRVPGLQVLAG